MKHKRVLVVDDEKNLRESLIELLESENYQAEEASDGAEAWPKIRRQDLAAVLLDIRMPQMDGLQLLAKLREENLTQTPVIVISAYGDSQQTIEAMRLGAFDYITKPLDIDELLQILARAVNQFEQWQNVLTLQNGNLAKTQQEFPATKIIGASRAIRDVFKQIGRVAATNATVLITGESGTGKELAARQIHEHSARRSAPFVAVNCGALPENLVEAELFGYEKGAFTGAVAQKKGRFELAQQGTIFLDEIGEMPLPAQVKLLRVLQERKIERVGGTNLISVNVRIIAATNRDLPTEIAAQNFREDLFYRLNVVSIHLSPLRDRLADLPQLAEFFSNERRAIIICRPKPYRARRFERSSTMIFPEISASWKTSSNAPSSGAVFQIRFCPNIFLAKPRKQPITAPVRICCKCRLSKRWRHWKLS